MRKTHEKNINTEKQQETCLCDPIEVAGGQCYVWPSKPQANETHQAWSGYVPKCTMKNKELAKYYSVQTENIKVNNIYQHIELQGDQWMDLACAEALESAQREGGPFGAVILQIDKETNQIIRYWKNHNQVTKSFDPTAHAEVVTIRSACASLGVFNLGEIKKEDAKLPQPGELSYCVIYSSTEPCPMCYSAICWANLKALFFAATRFDASVQGVRFSDEEIYNELATPYSSRTLKVAQLTSPKSLDAFNHWKVSEKINY